MRWSITKRHLAIAVFSLGMGLLGSLAILSAMFGLLGLWFFLTQEHYGGFQIFLVSVGMFVPGISLFAALLTVFLPTSPVWKIVTCCIGLVFSLPATGLYVATTGKESLWYLLPITALFLWSWSQLAFTSKQLPK